MKIFDFLDQWTPKMTISQFLKKHPKSIPKHIKLNSEIKQVVSYVF